LMPAPIEMANAIHCMYGMEAWTNQSIQPPMQLPALTQSQAFVLFTVPTPDDAVDRRLLGLRGLQELRAVR
jgi:hypothetical protein